MPGSAACSENIRRSLVLAFLPMLKERDEYPMTRVTPLGGLRLITQVCRGALIAGEVFSAR